LNDVELMSIGSQLRLDHLEDQQLRKKNTNSTAKPPKISKKSTNLSNGDESVLSGISN
jgi:hypothetical protein